MELFWIRVGAIVSGLAVAAGAFGAHGLRGKLLDADLQTFEVAVRYQMYHGLALLAVAWLASRGSGAMVNAAGWFFLGGIIVFSGSLYVLVLTGERWLGAITPIGGLSLLAGWACLLLSTRS